MNSSMSTRGTADFYMPQLMYLLRTVDRIVLQPVKCCTMECRKKYSQTLSTFSPKSSFIRSDKIILISFVQTKIDPFCIFSLCLLSYDKIGTVINFTIIVFTEV